MHELSRYQFEPLWTEGEYVLSRSVRDAALAPLLTVAPAVAQPAPESLQRLAHAYALREALEPAWATRPLALGWAGARPLPWPRCSPTGWPEPAAPWRTRASTSSSSRSVPTCPT